MPRRWLLKLAGLIGLASSPLVLVACAPEEEQTWSDGTLWSDGTGWVD